MIFESLITDWIGSIKFHRAAHVLNRSITIFIVLVIFLLISPIGVTVFENYNNTNLGYESSIDQILINPSDAALAENYINKYRRENELVIGSPGFVWQLANPVSDFQVSLIRAGINTFHLPGNLPITRYDFDPRFDNARYIVIDNIWRNWASINMPEIGTLMEKIENEWQLVFRAGDIYIYER